MAKYSNSSDELKPLKQVLATASSYIEPHRRVWKAIYDQVYGGTPTSDLEDWQASFSLPTLNTTVTQAKTDLTDEIINKSDWYDLDERNPSDADAKALKIPLKKLTDFYMTSANAKAVCNNAIGASIIAHGDVGVHWHQKNQLNPNWVTWQSRKKSKQPTDILQQYASMNSQDIANAIEGAGMDIEGFLAGEKLEKEPPKYIQVGSLRFDTPHFTKTYWDPKATTISSSRWRAYDFTLYDYEIREYIKLGVFKPAAAELLKRRSHDNCYSITAYYGPRFKMVDNVKEISNEGYYCMWSGDCILVSGDYPYLEIDDQYHPMATAIAKSVPFSNAGQSPSEYGAEMAKWHDHNWRLVCDQLRFGILGFNAVNVQAIENRELLDNGLEPGSIIMTKGDPREAFSHIPLTSNRENQYHPVNEVLRDQIVQSIGTTGVGSGLGSRATSKEVQAVQSNASKAVRSMAQELQDSFVLPFLQRVFARVIQFGLKDLATNPAAQAALTEEELQMLLQLSEESQIRILQTFYRFKLRPYTSKDEDAEKLDNIASILNAASSNPYFQQAINYKKMLSLMTKLLSLEEEALINTEPSELDVIMSENLLLEQGKPLQPGQMDNHELHMEQQAPGPNATPAALQHYQMHQQILQGMQKSVDNTNGGMVS